MTGVLKKLTLVSLLLVVCMGHGVRAEVKVYQYDGNLPFVQMMLNMMVAMGILDRIPNRFVYGGSGNSLYGNSLYNRYNNPYSRLRGLNSFAGTNPFLRSPWINSPWGSSVFGPDVFTDSWGSGWNDFGPYNLYDNPYSDVYDGYGRNDSWNSPWSQDDLDGWVDEPWETSSWNKERREVTMNDDRKESSRESARAQAPVNNVPLIQNFNYNVPPEKQQPPAEQSVARQQHQQVAKSSPLSRLSPPPQRQASRPMRKPAENRRPKTAKRYSKPCITDFCGLKKPDMNGLWMAKNGEMLGINNDRYLWSDGTERYLTGQLLIQNEYLVANVDGHDNILRFKYKTAGHHLVTLQPDGTVREFRRVPVEASRNFY